MCVKPSPAGAIRARIMIVASDPDTCMLLTGLFAREGFYTALICDISEMGKVLREEAPPDAVLLDESFPVEKVESLVRCIRSHKQWDKVSTIILSARDAEQVETAFFDMGVDDFIVKPLKTKALIARVKRRIQSA